MKSLFLGNTRYSRQYSFKRHLSRACSKVHVSILWTSTVAIHYATACSLRYYQTRWMLRFYSSVLNIDWVRNRISKEKVMPRNGITQFSSLSPYILKLKQDIFHMIFPNNSQCPCGLDLICVTTKW